MQGWEPPVHVGLSMSPLLVKTFVIWLYAGVLSGCLAIRTVFVTQYATNWLKVEVKPNSVILILCTFHFVNHHISDRQIHGVNPPPGFHFACPQIRNQWYPLVVPPPPAFPKPWICRRFWSIFIYKCKTNSPNYTVTVNTKHLYCMAPVREAKRIHTRQVSWKGRFFHRKMRRGMKSIHIIQCPYGQKQYWKSYMDKLDTFERSHTSVHFRQVSLNKVHFINDVYEKWEEREKWKVST